MHRIAEFFSGHFSLSLRRGKTGPRHAHDLNRRLDFERLESRQMLAASSLSFSDGNITSLSPIAVSQSTGEKPQSKLWMNDGHWWSVMPDKTGTWIWRLDGTAWTHVLQLSAQTKIRADVLSQGDLVQILLVDASKPANSRLATVEYVAGTPGSYQPWSVRPDLTSVPLSNSDETATLAVDSTGEMWIVSDVTTTVEVRHSAYPYISVSAPITIGTGISKDDISVITAMPNGQVGVLWSNQQAKRFYFSTHQDGDDPGSWSAVEVPANQSALKVGHGMADDHLNFAVASDGTLYAAIKTSYDTSGKAKIGLLIRRPSGTWDPLYTVDTGGTRPLVLLDEAIGRLMVVFATATTGGNIVFRETPLDQIAFSARTMLIRGHLDNVTSTKQNVADQIVVMAGNGEKSATKAFSALLTIPLTAPPPSDPILFVNAGLDQTIKLPAEAKLHSVVTQGGAAIPAGTVLITWSCSSGPGTVIFSDPTLLDTTATFSVEGTYTLRITADDGQQTALDELVVVVNPVSATL